jgi:regulatory protein
MTKKITSLRVQKRNKQRVNVFLDGEFAFGLTRIVASWLQVGQELTDQKIADLKHKDEIEVGLQKALRFLSYRPRSVNEVRLNLKKHHIDEVNIETIIERLQQNKLVNDAEFAQLWVENRSEFRPRGRRALQMELRQKGLADSEIDQAVSGLDEESLAYRAGRKQARKYKELEWKEFRTKMSAFLARRGFDYAIISSIIPIIWKEHQLSHEDHHKANEV